MTDQPTPGWIPRDHKDHGHDTCGCHCYHCRPRHSAGLKCANCGFMPAPEPWQLLTDASVLLATALLAGATHKDIHDALDDAVHFAENGSVPHPGAAS